MDAASAPELKRNRGVGCTGHSYSATHNPHTNFGWGQGRRSGVGLIMGIVDMELESFIAPTVFQRE